MKHHMKTLLKLVSNDIGKENMPMSRQNFEVLGTLLRSRQQRIDHSLGAMIP